MSMLDWLDTVCWVTGKTHRCCLDCSMKLPPALGRMTAYARVVSPAGVA